MNAPAPILSPAALLAGAKYHHAVAKTYRSNAASANSIQRRYDEDDAEYHEARRNWHIDQLQALGVEIPGYAPYTAKHRADLVDAFLKE